jgi:hypothetical protein
MLEDYKLKIHPDRELIVNETLKLLFIQIDLLKLENINENKVVSEFISIRKRENRTNQKITGVLCILAGIMLSLAIWINFLSSHDQRVNLAVGMISTFGLSCAAFSLAQLIFAELKSGSEIRSSRQVGDNPYTAA